MATEKVTRGVLLVVSEEIGHAASAVLTAAGHLNPKAVTGPRAALGAIGQLQPQILVFEAGRVPVAAMQAVKNMAELAASRKVPVIMVCGPVDETVQQLSESLGIVKVLDEPYASAGLLEVIQEHFEKLEQARRDSQLRHQKQQQIRARLRNASDKYAAMSAEAAAEKLSQPEVQDFASDDIAPPAEPDPNKPPNEPTWDGSGN